MEIKELREKSIEELTETLKKLRKDTEEAMDGLLKGKEKDLRKPRLLRKDIAKVLTTLKEKSNA